MCFYKFPLAACVLFKYLIPSNPFLLTINCATNRAMIAALRARGLRWAQAAQERRIGVGGGGTAQLTACRVNTGQISCLFGSQDYNPSLSRAVSVRHTAYRLARQERSRAEYK